MKNPRIGTALSFALSMVAAAAAGLYYGRSTSTAPPEAAPADGHDEHDEHDEHKAESAEAHGKDAESGHAEGDAHGEGHGHGAAEVSDLDRPVDELFAGKCEHDIPHYSCDECRYELGVVKLDADVVSREVGKPGLFTFTGGVARNSAATRALRRLVEENYGEKTVNISPDIIYTGALGAALFAHREAMA